MPRNDRGRKPERRTSPGQTYHDGDEHAVRPHVPPPRRVALDPPQPHYRASEGERGGTKRRQQYPPPYGSSQQADAWDPHAAAGMKRARRSSDPRREQGGGGKGEGWQRSGHSHEEYYEEEEEGEEEPGYAYAAARPHRGPSSVRFSQDMGQQAQRHHQVARGLHPHQAAARPQHAQYYQQQAEEEEGEEGEEEEGEEEGFDEEEGDEDGFEEDEGEERDESEGLEEEQPAPRPNPFIALYGLPVRSELQIHSLVSSILDAWGIEVHKVMWRRRKLPDPDDGAGVSKGTDEKVLVQLCDPSQINSAISIFAGTKFPRLKEEHVAAAAARAADVRAQPPPARPSPPRAAAKHASSEMPSPPSRVDVGGAGGPPAWVPVPRRTSQGGGAPPARVPGPSGWRQTSPEGYGSQAQRAAPGAQMGKRKVLSPYQAPSRPHPPSILKPSSGGRGPVRHVQRYEYQGGGPVAATPGPAAAAAARSRENAAAAGVTAGGARSNNRYVLKMPPAKRAELAGRDAPFPSGQCLKRVSICVHLTLRFDIGVNW